MTIAKLKIVRRGLGERKILAIINIKNNHAFIFFKECSVAVAKMGVEVNDEYFVGRIYRVNMSNCCCDIVNHAEARWPTHACMMVSARKIHGDMSN